MLNNQQFEILNYVVNEEKSACIPAFAGTGKTYLANELIAAMRLKDYEILSCCFTGKSASLLKDGVTAHRASGLGIGKESTLPKGVLSEKRLYKGQIRSTLAQASEKADRRWLSEKLFVLLDEMSQFSSEDARLWYDVGMHLRKAYAIKSGKKMPDPVFVVMGDFGQFLPISGNLIFEQANFEYYDPAEKREVRLSLPSIFEDIKPKFFALTKIMRQTDPKYLKALRFLYYGIAVHPIILNRFEEAPVECSTHFFNNALVSGENIRLLSKHKSNNFKKFSSLTDTLTEAEKKYLLPVETEATIYLDSPFTITVNVYDTINNNLLVSNGEVVTVKGFNNRSLKVKKANGKTIELNYVNHYLPFNQHDGSKKTFCFLPGYPGGSCSIMKVQGETYVTPIKFAVWQMFKGQWAPLKHSGAVYTICSRPTELKYLYFDVSLGIDCSRQLFKDSLYLDPKVLNFLLQGKEPLWIVDGKKERFVIEIQSCQAGRSDKLKNMRLCEYEYTCLVDGSEKKVVCGINYDPVTKDCEFLAYGIRDESGAIKESTPDFPEIYMELMRRFISQN